ncbi:MAG TPA: SH3 domain-containing protein [Candidatus Pullilachnospira intestinigallinarum]|nr:SH3 domain-containing protein [Candidatus Pullilachnospira intestinigallinarum]
MTKKRISLILAGALCLMLAAGCGKALDVAGDILSLSVADTGKDGTEVPKTDDAQLPRRQVTVSPTQFPTATATPTPEPTEKAVRMVTCTSPVNVRDGASTGSNVIGMLSAGDTAEYVGQEGGWVIILYEGREAYVYQDYVKIDGRQS